MRVFQNSTKHSAAWRHGLYFGACVAGMLAAASPVSAGCQWTFGPGRNVVQGRMQISFTTFSQNGNKFSGRVWLWGSPDAGSFSSSRAGGSAKGQFEGDVLSFVVAWDGGLKGEYRGTIDANGNIPQGITFDVQHPENTASWWMHGFTCEPIVEPAAATPEASAPPLPVKKLGKRRIPEPVNKVPFDVTGAGGGGLAADVAPQAPAQPPQQIATAIDDVDMFKGPGGEFDRYEGFMEAGSEAPVLGHEEGWYRLKLDVPGGSAWVAEDHLKIKP